MFHCHPLAKYCVDDFFGGHYGAMSFDVTTNDDADTATVEIVAGYAKGWLFEGLWDGEGGLGSGAVGMIGVTLVTLLR